MLHRLIIFFVLLMGSSTIATDHSISDLLFKRYTKLAKNGDPDSMFIVADMYENGKGVPIDFSEAIRWYQSSAKHGNALAVKRVKRVNRKMHAQFDK